jgi:hypothetical protein
MKQKNLLNYFLFFLGFAALFAVIFVMNKSDLAREFVSATAKVPSIKNFGSATADTMKQYFSAYGYLAGLALGLVAYLASLLLYGALKIVRLAKYKLANMLALFLVYGAYLVLGIELFYYEDRYSALAIAIVFFIGYPLLYASGIISVLIFIFYFYSFFKDVRFKKAGAADGREDNGAETGSVDGKMISLILSLIVMPFVLSGCNLIGGFEGIACLFIPDSAHCYQGAAVDNGDPGDCEKVVQPEKFKDLGSNPPKDKCYLMVAQNTGDLDACDKIAGGPMSYTKEECFLTVSVENENPSGCNKLAGNDKARCIAELAPLMTPDKVLEVDKAISDLKDILKNGPDPDLEKQLQGLEGKRNDILGVMTKDNKAEYDRQSDPMNQQIIGDFAVGDIDSATKNKLVAFNEKLKSQGLDMTADQYQAFKDYYKFMNDPENDIEKMDDDKLLKDRWNEKVGNAVDALKFWNSNKTPEEEAVDQQLRFYERMLERQTAIIKSLSSKQQDFDRNMDMVFDAAKDKVKDEIKDKLVESLFGELAGKTAGMTTAIVGEALDTVKAEAKSAEFRGLVRAYDSGMAEEIGKFGGDAERAHAEVVKKLAADPYAYASGASFAKYGNLLENKDCDGTNPHCINRDVFWKAMKKSYNYQHRTD